MLGLCVPPKSTSRFMSLSQSSVGCVQHRVYLWQCAQGKAPDHDLQLSLRLSSTLLQKMSDSCTDLAGCDEPPRTDACLHNTDSEALRGGVLKSDAQTARQDMSKIKQLLPWVFWGSRRSDRFTASSPFPHCSAQGGLLGSLKFLHDFPTLLNSPLQLWEVQKMPRLN